MEKFMEQELKTQKLQKLEEARAGMDGSME
jgi:hypothetical protein